VDVYILLDVLLLILIALFIPIGFWRGAFREGFVTLGILFGAALAGFWGESWGADLASVTRLHESGGAFMVAMLCLIGSTFLLGYSAGAAVPVPEPGWVTRTIGALVAGANGALLLSFALRDIRVFLLAGQDTAFLDRAVVAPFLSDGAGWILLISAAIFIPIVMVVALFGATEEYDVYDDEQDYEHYSSPEDTAVSLRPRAEPIEQHYAAYRTEPRRHESAAHQFAAYKKEPPPRDDLNLAQETRPILASDETLRPETSNGELEESTQHELRFGFQPPDEDLELDDDETLHVSPSPRPTVTDGRCPNCHADVSNARGYCPSCGRVI
jgi:uncharacterized membrane protein required for colicin V production